MINKIRSSAIKAPAPSRHNQRVAPEKRDLAAGVCGLEREAVVAMLIPHVSAG